MEGEMIVWLWLACAGQETQHIKLLDRQYYTEAMGLSGQDSVVLCKKIQSVALQGECVLFTAKNLAQHRQDSRGICSFSPTESWRGACVFDVIDILGMTGDMADKACAQSGEFQSRCMMHALLREEEILAKAFPAGQEKALMEAVQARMTKMDVEDVEEEPLWAILTARIIARRFEASWRQNRNLEFSKTHCGTASEETCSNAYRIAVKQIGRGKRPSNCSLPMDTKRVLATALPIWSEDMAELAQQAWKSVCHINHGPTKAPDHISSQRAKER
jgi:hypothetical protein